jgi:hypothetical protein
MKTAHRKISCASRIENSSQKKYAFRDENCSQKNSLYLQG